MRHLFLVTAVVLLSGCIGADESTANEAASSTGLAADPTASIGEEETASVPPVVEPGSGIEPVALPELGSGVWLIEAWEAPDVVVRVDGQGAIIETLWEQDADIVGSFDAGHTLLCEDVDGDGEADLVDLRFSFDGPLENVYAESRSFGGNVIEEKTQPIDGTNVPAEIHQICGQSSAGPFFRITARQWSAALEEAGFIDIAGDHAIDPVWEAGAWWGGHEYWPLSLYQGDVRPDPGEDVELIECELGAIEIPRNLPDEARSALAEVSGCP